MFSSSSGGTILTASPPQLHLSTMPEYSTQPLGTDAAAAGAHAPGDPKRRSTGASDALQYYWSSSAGERASSTGSSFGMSPIDSSPRPNILSSPYTLSPHPILHEERSHRSLRELVQEEEEEDRRRIIGSSDGNSTIRGKASSSSTTNPNVAGTTWDPRFSDATEVDRPERRERTHGMERTRLLIPEGENGSSDAGPGSNRHIHLISYSSDGSMSALASGPSVPSSLNKLSPGTPGSPSNSSESEYSFLDDDPVAPPRREEQRASTIARNQQHRHGVVDADGELHVLLDPTFEEWAHQRIWGHGDPDSSAPNSTDVHSSDRSSRYNSMPNSQPSSQPPSNPVSPPLHPPQSNNEPWRTPTQPPSLDHAAISPIDWPTRTPSPGLTLNNRASSSTAAPDRTPRNSQAQTPRASFRPSPPASDSPNARLLFVASSDLPRRSLDTLQQQENPGLGLGGPGAGQRSSPSGSPVPPGTPGRLEDLDHPRSAPPTKTSFSDIGVVGSDTRAARATSLQAPAPISAQTTKSQKLLSPEEATPLATARRSPEPPPRSERRKQTPNSDTAIPLVSEPEEMSPISPVAGLGTPLPTIINTASTPVASPQAPGRTSAGARSHAASSPVPAPMQRYGSNSPKPKPKTAPGTIQDLTDMLGGAIDDIGLVDSRNTPPPSIPLKEGGMLASLPARSTSSTQSRSASHGSATTVTSKSIEDHASAVSPTMSTFSAASTSFSASPSAPSRPSPLAPATLSSSNNVGLGLSGGVGGGPQRPGASRHVRKASSILSLRSSNHSFSPTVPTFTASAGQLPAAVLFGNIKALRTAGERARAYASSLEALAEADSGLRAWYTAALSGARPQRPVVLGGGGKASTMSHLGLSDVPGSMFNLNLYEPSQRNVSAGSEFPMRPDAYSAREISVRNLDPSDGPTALPPNLPYPQLQTQLGGNVRPSTSLQSIASVSTNATKRGGGGFFSGIGRALKKDKDPGLGPPTGQLGTSLTTLNQSASSSKRDLKSGAGKGYTPPPGGRSSLDSLGDSSLSAPVPRALGPRGPRDGIPTSRVSMDVPRPMGAQAMPRGSLDGGGPRTAARMGGGGGGGGGFGGPGFGAGVQGGPRTLSPLARGDSASVSDADVQQLCDYIPHADRSVARVYIQRYKGLAEAVTAYIEDDKNGVLMRAGA